MDNYASQNTATKIIMAAGDRLRLVRAVLEDSEGVVVNLAGCDVAFRMVDYYTGSVVINNQPAVKQQIDSNPSTWGSVVYVWGEGETDTAGLYRCWWIVTNTGLTNHFPPDGDFFILIQDAP